MLDVCWHQAHPLPGSWCAPGRPTYQAQYRGAWRNVCDTHISRYRDCPTRLIQTAGKGKS